MFGYFLRGMFLSVIFRIFDTTKNQILFSLNESVYMQAWLKQFDRFLPYLRHERLKHVWEVKLMLISKKYVFENVV